MTSKYTLLSNYIEQVLVATIGKSFLYIDRLFSKNYVYGHFILLGISVLISGSFFFVNNSLSTISSARLFCISLLVSVILNYTLRHSTTIQNGIKTSKQTHKKTAEQRDLIKIYRLSKQSFRILYIIPILVLVVSLGMIFNSFSGVGNAFLHVLSVYLRLILIYSLVSLLTIYYTAKEYAE